MILLLLLLLLLLPRSTSVGKSVAQRTQLFNCIPAGKHSTTAACRQLQQLATAVTALRL
jgi:hypothetical protein